MRFNAGRTFLNKPAPFRENGKAHFFDIVNSYVNFSRSRRGHAIRNGEIKMYRL